MKEFIDKLIKSFKELPSYYSVDNGRMISLEDTIGITKALAEEYKVSEMPTGSEDCCKWVLIDYDANVYDTTCRNPHILLEGSPTDNSYEFCPYCGKKIKVAPYTEGE